MMMMISQASSEEMKPTEASVYDTAAGRADPAMILKTVCIMMVESTREGSLAEEDEEAQTN